MKSDVNDKLDLFLLSPTDKTAIYLQCKYTQWTNKTKFIGNIAKFAKRVVIIAFC